MFYDRVIIPNDDDSTYTCHDEDCPEFLVASIHAMTLVATLGSVPWKGLEFYCFYLCLLILIINFYMFIDKQQLVCPELKEREKLSSIWIISHIP